MRRGDTERQRQAEARPGAGVWDLDVRGVQPARPAAGGLRGTWW